MVPEIGAVPIWLYKMYKLNIMPGWAVIHNRLSNKKTPAGVGSEAGVAFVFSVRYHAVAFYFDGDLTLTERLQLLRPDWE
jgi:hypothetical protein